MNSIFTMGNLTFTITAEHICPNMIDEESLASLFNGDAMAAYKAFSDNYSDSIINFSESEKILSIVVTNNAKLTVALPMYDSSNIAWLAMESLCRQQDINFKWELIICEEQMLSFAGKDFFYQYKDRLSEVGCVSVKYIPLQEWIPLSQKWRLMARSADVSSEVFVLQASDCFSQPYRLFRTYKVLTNQGGYNWYQSVRGYFYHIKNGKSILYDHSSLGRDTRFATALNMATLMKYAKALPLSDKRKGVDGWMYRTIPEPKVFNDVHKSWRLGVDTHGANHISINRDRHFQTQVPPFMRSSVPIGQIIPKDIAERLLKMR